MGEQMNATDAMTMLEDAARDDQGVVAALIFLMNGHPLAANLLAILHPNLGDFTPCPSTQPDGKGPGNP